MANDKKTKKLEQAETAVEENITEAAIDAAEQTETVKEEKRTTTPVAKAGKRSTKALAEAEEKEAKEERKAEAKAEETAEKEKPKVAVTPTRSRLERRGKKYREQAKQVDATKQYSLSEALELASKTSPTKFDATVEVHVRLGLDPRQADQNIRDIVILPAGTGKTVRVAVFAEDDDAKKAKAAGADIAGNEDFLASLDKGQLDFDVLIATPNLMAKLAKYARVLGPKGLMPNPKSGTVTKDVVKAVEQSKAGRIEYRVDSTGIVHVGVGKVSFGAQKLGDNVAALFTSIKQNKPASLKGIYVRSIAITTTMGPAVKVAPSELS
jgi:large subunit ribosomal protein L1